MKNYHIKSFGKHLTQVYNIHFIYFINLHSINIFCLVDMELNMNIEGEGSKSNAR